MKNFLRCISFVLLFCIALLSISCKQSTTTVTGNIGTGESGSDATTIVPTEETDVFTDRDADTSYSEDDALSLVLVDDATFSEDERIQIDGNVVTLTGAGTYLISGSLTRGQIRINASDSDKLHLILDGVSINSAGSAALYILNADKVFIITSGENMAIHAGANIAMAVENFKTRGYASLGGIILNRRNVAREEEKVKELADDFKTQVIGTLSHSELVAEAEEEGKTVMECFPGSEMAEEYRKLAEVIYELSKESGEGWKC